MKKIFAGALLAIMSVTSSFGAWAVVSLEELVAESDLIVVGTLHSATEDHEGIGRGRIEIEEIVSGKARTLEGRPLSVGDNLRINWADNWACAQGMHERRIGEKGVWLLDILEDGTVSAAYPGKFTKLEDLFEIRRLLRGRKHKRLQSVDVAGDEPVAAPNTPTVNPTQVHIVDVSSYHDYSPGGAATVFLFAIWLYWILYKSRFRIR